MGQKRNRRDLRTALEAGQPVLVRRNLWKADHLEGFVVRVDREWAVLHLVVDVDLNGWTAVRLDSVRDVVLLRADAFITRALAWAGERPVDPGLDTSSVQDLLRSAHRAGADQRLAGLARHRAVVEQRARIDPQGPRLLVAQASAHQQRRLRQPVAGQERLDAKPLRRERVAKALQGRGADRLRAVEGDPPMAHGQEGSCSMASNPSGDASIRRVRNPRWQAVHECPSGCPTRRSRKRVVRLQQKLEPDSAEPVATRWSHSCAHGRRR